MNDYESGTVAVATVDGEPNVRIFIDASPVSCVTTANGQVWGLDYGDVTDIRPLVVIDNIDWPSLIRLLRASGFSNLADQIEAQTKPARISEPGLWGVVEAGVKQHCVRLQWINLGGRWRSTAEDEYDRMWADLVDPTLIRDGIEDGAE